ncbi:MAG: VWA domain-containing protein [Planctomycetota bacterium]|nr:VWA domain-containing protein [Planctomycetota bacterium]
MIPGFHALSSAWLFFLFIPVVLFYFLKLKRPRQEVPSLLLWRQVLQDQRVNSPFQRFKRNILLILQLLLLLLLVLAAMQPYWRGQASTIRRLPILIDTSASMAALDKAGGKSRLEVAREQVALMIDNLASDQELGLIAFGRTGRKLTDFTSNKRILRDALETLSVQDVPSDVEDGLRIAQALARSTPFDQAMLLSDGNFPMPERFDLPFKLDYRKLPGAGPNVGITALVAQRTGQEGWALFVSVETSSESPAGAAVELLRDGKPVQTADLTVTRGKAERLSFKFTLDKPASFEVRLKPDGFDSLAADNVAFIDLAPARSVFVYAAPECLAARAALAVQPGVRLFPEEGKAGPGDSRYDLVITNKLADASMTSPVFAFLGVVPEDLKPLVRLSKTPTSAIDWTRTAPLVAHVELTDLLVVNGSEVGQGVRDNDFENLSYEALAYGQHGPLILQKRDATRSAYFILFAPEESTFPYRVGFPVMLANLVQQAMQQAGLAETQGQTTGVLPPQHFLAESNYTIQSPDGQTWTEKSDARGMLAGVAANRVGRYKISGSGAADKSVGVGLLNTSETSLTGAEQIRFAEASVKAESTATLKIDRSYWPWLAALALTVLLVEWWYYQRRPGGYAA